MVPLGVLVFDFETESAVAGGNIAASRCGKGGKAKTPGDCSLGVLR